MLAGVDRELAEQPEVDVTDLAGVPSIEQVLAMRLDLVERGAVDTGRVGGESALRAGHADR